MVFETRTVLIQKMLRARLNTFVLDPSNSLVGSFTLQVRVAAKALPEPATFRGPSQVHRGSQGDVNAFAPELFAHGFTPSPHEMSVESRCRIDPCGERGDVVRQTNAQPAKE